MSTHHSRVDGSSGDLIADRRHAWASAAAREGDHAAAAELFEQALELAPAWAPAWFALGEAREKLGARGAAIEAFEQAAARDPSGALGADLRLAALGARAAPASAPAAYVRALFDQYAPHFDTHLVETLSYCGPELLRAAVERACAARGRPFHFRRALDLGCGTGLMAKALDPRAGAFVGVDVSPKMAEAARATGLYSHLEVGDLGGFLATQGPASADLVVAADVFVYIGDLDAIFAQCARALERGGLLAFSAQAGEDAWALGADLRYAHSPSYLRALAAARDFEIVCLEEASTRKDAGADVPGLVCVMARA